MTIDRWARLPVRAVLAAIVAVLAWSTLTSPEVAGLPTWRLVAGAVAALVVIVTLLLDATWRAEESTRSALRWLPLVALSGAVTVVLLALGGDRLAWLPVVVIVTAGRGLEAVPAALVAVPPVVAFAVSQWWQGATWPVLGVNLLAFVAVFSWMQLRRRQREATQLAAAQAQIISAERARSLAAERQREVAAQLHDVPAHTLSGLIISLRTASLQAQAEQVSPALQERLEAATELAREGLAGARRAVEGLTRDAPETPDGPPLAQWFADLTRRLEVGAGLAITTRGDLAIVPPERAEVVRAVLLEATTNSVRHAGGAPVHVEVDADRVAVLTVGAGRADHRGGGHGLTGLRERVERSGGAFEAGPTDRGWQVCATWPQAHWPKEES